MISACTPCRTTACSWQCGSTAGRQEGGENAYRLTLIEISSVRCGNVSYSSPPLPAEPKRGAVNQPHRVVNSDPGPARFPLFVAFVACVRSEEHTSELQSQSNLVCRLLLEKKK